MWFMNSIWMISHIPKIVFQTLSHSFYASFATGNGWGEHLKNGNSKNHTAIQPGNQSGETSKRLDGFNTTHRWGEMCVCVFFCLSLAQLSEGRWWVAFLKSQVFEKILGKISDMHNMFWWIGRSGRPVTVANAGFFLGFPTKHVIYPTNWHVFLSNIELWKVRSCFFFSFFESSCLLPQTSMFCYDGLFHFSHHFRGFQGLNVEDSNKWWIGHVFFLEMRMLSLDLQGESF